MSTSDANDRDVRVADYLDDKLQTLADLQSLDSLLSNIREQHGLLKGQLDQAQKDHAQARNDSHQHAADVRGRAEQYQRDQAGIDRRLKIVTQSETSDDAVRKFEVSMDRLRRLDITSGYIGLLVEVDRLSKESQSRLKTSSKAALDPYRQLQTLTSSLVPLQVAAEGAAPQLLHHIATTTGNLRRQIKDSFAAELEDVLKKIYWPKEGINVPPTLHQAWSDSVGKLLELQKPELQSRENASGRQAPREPVVLMPMEILVQPLEMRFRYHFEGDKPTNRIDKPEWFFSHVLELLNSYNGFMVDNLQPLLLDHFRGTDLALNPLFIDATSALITALLPMTQKKVFSLLPRIANQPQLLSHLIHEIMNFDNTTRDEWGYDGGAGVEGWKGLAWSVLVEKDVFRRWQQVESDFALQRYHEILEQPDRWELDYESFESAATKPTKAAIRVNDLLETVTDHYRLLPTAFFSQKLSFLIDVQISIFDRFHHRLRDMLEAYISATSSIGRTMHGAEDVDLSGINGLQHLLRIYNSAEYLERAMRDWSDDVFFLELWEELQDRARGRTAGGRGNVAGDMSVADVAEKTSAAVGTEDDTGALFDETAESYRRLRVRSEGTIVDLLNDSIHAAIRPYRKLITWNSIVQTSSASLSTSAELDPLLNVVSELLGHLSKTLAPAPLRRITRQVTRTIQDVLWNRVLTAHSFSTAGAAQLGTDFRALCAAVDRYVGLGVAESGMRKLGEGIRLVGLPVKGTASQTAAAGMGDDEAAAGAARDGDEDGTVVTGRLGLWEVDRRLFADNESARAVLEDLGMEVLTENEAREVLRRRVELGS